MIDGERERGLVEMCRGQLNCSCCSCAIIPSAARYPCKASLACLKEIVKRGRVTLTRVRVRARTGTLHPRCVRHLAAERALHSVMRVPATRSSCCSGCFPPLSKLPFLSLTPSMESSLYCLACAALNPQTCASERGRELK